MFKLLVSACLFILASCHKSIPYTEQDHIINLGLPSWLRATKDFEQGLFIYFSHPSCTYCKVVFPEVKQAALNLFEAKSHVQFAKADCHDEIEFCQLLKVDQYPAMLLYRAEKPIVEYRGLRTAQAIKTWIGKVIDGEFEKHGEQKTLFRRFSTAILIKYLLYPEEINIAYRYLSDDIEVAIQADNLPEIHFGYSGVIHSQGGRVERFAIDETHDSDWIRARINQILYEERSEVPNFNAAFWKKLKSDYECNFVFFFRTDNYDPTQDATQAYDNVARKRSNDALLFTYVNTDEVYGDTVAKWFGVLNSDNSAVGILSKKGNVFRKYKLDSKITEGTVRDLLDNFMSDEQRYYVSAPVPNVKEGEVQELVGSNFKTVINSGKNILVFFYFQRNVLSAKFDNIWETLAYRFRKNPNVVVAKIDMYENDVEGIEIESYPVVRLYLPNSKYIDFKSLITLQNIKDFLIENVSGLETEIEL